MLKRSGFRKQSLEEVKIKQASKKPHVKQKKPKVTQTSYKDVKASKVAKQAKQKESNKGYKAPKWFNKIPPGSHGNNPALKRAWKAISDLYRQEDFLLYQGHCPICHTHIERWQDLQLGHFHRYSLCNSWFKLERRNLLGICAGCNINDGGLTSFKFAERLKQRYGEDIILWIELENKTYVGKKMEAWALVDFVARLRPELVEEVINTPHE